MKKWNQREKALRRIQELGFMTDDIRLFLNTHPDCDEALCALRHFIMLEREATADYEQRYGALTLEGLEKAGEYNWIHHAWPWEVEA